MMDFARARFLCVCARVRMRYMGLSLCDVVCVYVQQCHAIREFGLETTTFLPYVSAYVS